MGLLAVVVITRATGVPGAQPLSMPDLYPERVLLA
jgi:hypothetical protein